MSVLSSRLERVKLSPSSAIRATLADLRGQGRRIIDLTVGEPDIPTPAHIRRAGCRAIESGETKYPLSQGTIALREAIQGRLNIDIGISYDIKQIIVGTGAKQVLFNAFAATLDEGDEVIIPAPYWVSYPDMVSLNSGRPVCVPAQASTSYKLTGAALRAAITSKTKWLVINSPNNPSGAIYSEHELRDLAAALRAHEHVWVMTDDIYSRLTFTGSGTKHLLQIAPDLADRTLVVNGVSKAFAMTGWRIGYGAGPAELVEAMAVVQSQSTSGASSIGQAAALEALSGSQDCVGDFATSLRARRDEAMGILGQIPGIAVVPPDGAFYLFPDCSGLLGKRTPGGRAIETDTDLVQHILHESGVALVNGTSYGIPGTFRLSFAASMDELKAGCESIRRICMSLHET